MGRLNLSLTPLSLVYEDPFPNTFPFLNPAPTSYKLNDKPRGAMDYKLTLQDTLGYA